MAQQIDTHTHNNEWIMIDAKSEFLQLFYPTEFDKAFAFWNNVTNNKFIINGSEQFLMKDTTIRDSFASSLTLNNNGMALINQMIELIFTDVMEHLNQIYQIEISFDNHIDGNNSKMDIMRDNLSENQYREIKTILDQIST